jgi:hypothetical protein
LEKQYIVRINIWLILTTFFREFGEDDQMCGYEDERIYGRTIPRPTQQISG